MMTRLPAEYRHLPRQTRSAGVAVLRLPVQSLLSQYLASFVRRGIGWLARGRPLADLQRCLEEAGLTQDELSLADGLPTILPPGYQWDGRMGDLNRLAAAADDLASDSGRWQEQFGHLKELCAQSAQELVVRCETLISRLLSDQGPAAARRMLVHVLGLVQHSHQGLAGEIGQHRTTCWTSVRSAELRLLGENLRHRSRRGGLASRVLERLPAALSSRLWWSEAQRASLRRQITTVNAAHRDRYRQSLFSARLDGLEDLLGREGQQGRLQRLLNSIKKHEAYLEDLSGQFAAGQHRTIEHSATELMLVESIETVLDPRSRQTLRDLYDQRLRQAGASFEDWAGQLLGSGLVIQGRVYLPHQWPALGPAVVANHLRRSAETYLGRKEALQCLLGVTLVDEALRGLLQQILPTFIGRSAPYATLRAISGAKPVEQVFLYCYPPQRAAWLAQIPYLPHAEEANAAGYALDDPYCVILCRYYLAIPGGGLHSLSRSMEMANTGYRRGRKPFLDRRQYPEMRLLGTRCGGHADAEGLFAAAEKARLVQAIGTPCTGFIPIRHDPRLDHLFSPRSYVPTWSDAAFFHALLKNGLDFTLLVTAALPALADFRQVQARLAREHEANLVASELVKLGVLERSPAGQFRVTFTPAAGACMAVPDGVYSMQTGPLAGLPRDQFIAAVQNDPHLHDVLFWGVRDAWQTGRLSENDVSAYIRQLDDE